MDDLKMKHTLSRWLTCLFLAAALLAGCAEEPSVDAPPESAQTVPEGPVDAAAFAAIRARSRKEASLPAAVKWEREHVREGGTRFTPIFNACGEKVQEGGDEPFTLLVRLSKDGKPTQLLVSPDTPFAECFRDGVARLRFPGAPWEGYWLEVVVRQ
jgi:hypothetical protein